MRLVFEAVVVICAAAILGVGVWGVVTNTPLHPVAALIWSAIMVYYMTLHRYSWIITATKWKLEHERAATELAKVEAENARLTRH